MNRQTVGLFRLIYVLVIAALGGFCIGVLSGCTTTSIKSPSGWSYESTRLMNDAALDEASIDPSTGAVTIKGARSESSKMADIFLEVLRTGAAARP